MTRRPSCSRTRTRSSRPTRAGCSTSSCRPRSSCSSSTPSRGSRATRSTGWHQASQARDRAHDQRAAVHHDRREDQGRHPRQQLPGPRPVNAPQHRRFPMAAARSKARKRAPGHPLRERGAGASRSAVRSRSAWRLGKPAVNDTRLRWSRVSEHRSHIDELVTPTPRAGPATGCRPVHRNALRIGVYEILYVDEVPDAVAVSEAMSLVRDLSTDEAAELRQRRARQHHPEQAGPLRLKVIQAERLIEAAASTTCCRRGRRSGRTGPRRAPRRRCRWTPRSLR